MNSTPFYKVLEQMIEHDMKARCPHWSTGVFIYVQRPDKNSLMHKPYLFISYKEDNVPWFPSYSEMFYDEWEISDK